MANWSKLPSELLELLVTKIDFIDVLHFKGVCSSFRLAAKVRSSAAPLLMHQSTTDCGDDDDFHRKFGKTVRFLSPQDMNAVIYSAQGKNCLERLLDKGCCVGSSHGWLLVLDKEVNPFLLNPFSGAEIELPKKETLPGIIDGGYRDIRVDYNGRVPKMSCFKKWKNGCGIVNVPTIQKAILTANPSYADDYKVFVICADFPRTIAFCCRGDIKWRPLRSSGNFMDVAFHNGRLYTTQFDVAPPPVYITKTIRTWDVSSTPEVPQECGCIVITDLEKQVYNEFPASTVTVRQYLVSSTDDLFLVFMISTRATIVRFEIYKLAGNYGKEFVRVESLPGQAMFLGGNHGMVISVQDYDNKLKENSIYFTYNYEDAYLKCYNYDIGIYSLENGSFNLLCDVQEKKPVPFWVFPGQR